MKSQILTMVALTLVAGGAFAGNPEAGKKFAKEVCSACHGENGNLDNSDFPKLGGQHQDYMAKALRDYQSGARNNAIMKAIVGTLKAEDIDNVTAWYASQPQVVTTHR